MKQMFSWNSFPFSMIQKMLTVWALVPLPFLKPVCAPGSSLFTYCWSLAWRILSITLLAYRNLVCSVPCISLVYRIVPPTQYMLNESFHNEWWMIKQSAYHHIHSCGFNYQFYDEPKSCFQFWPLNISSWTAPRHLKLKIPIIELFLSSLPHSSPLSLLGSLSQ